jgi:hypothetical protein
VPNIYSSSYSKLQIYTKFRKVSQSEHCEVSSTSNNARQNFVPSWLLPLRLLSSLNQRRNQSRLLFLFFPRAIFLGYSRVQLMCKVLYGSDKLVFYHISIRVISFCFLHIRKGTCAFPSGFHQLATCATTESSAFAARRDQ